MAKSRSKKVMVGKKKKMPPRPAPRGPVPRAPVLDAAARDYAALIADPCNAKLTSTIWNGSGGSFVSRFESDFIIGQGAGVTCAALVYVPNSNVVWVSDVALLTDSTAMHLAESPGAGPGYQFLENAGNIRAVASCVQLSFPGTEVDRSGIVSGGVMSFGSVAPYVLTAEGGESAVTKVGSLRSLSQHTERMPQDMMEITWSPGSGDMRLAPAKFQPTDEADIERYAESNAIVVTASGFKAAVGVRIRIVTVFEWTPSSGDGFVAAVEVPKSSNTLNDVLRAIPASKGTAWWINAYKKALPYARAAGSVISYGAKVLGPALLAL